MVVSPAAAAAAGVEAGDPCGRWDRRARRFPLLHRTHAAAEPPRPPRHRHPRPHLCRRRSTLRPRPAQRPDSCLQVRQGTCSGVKV